MNPRLILSSLAALTLVCTTQAATPEKRTDPPPHRPDSPRPPMARHHDDGPPRQRGDHPSGEHSELHARLSHLTQAIQHLRAAGMNEPAENLEKAAREMREQAGRQRRSDEGKSREAGPARPSHPHPSMAGGMPGRVSAELEQMRDQIRHLAKQMEELRDTMQRHRGDQPGFARPAPIEKPREGADRRPESREGPPRRPESSSSEDRPPQDTEHRRDNVQPRPPQDRPPGEPRKDAAPTDKPREPGSREGAPRDGAQRDGDKGGPLNFGRPSEGDRGRFMALSERAREKLTQEMRENRDKMMKATPEERMKFAKELFERVEAEDKSRKSEADSADDALRALNVKPPL